MALQTENVQVAGLDQAGIWRTVGGMADYATICFNRLVFEDERPLLVGVARVAHRISRGR